MSHQSAWALALPISSPSFFGVHAPTFHAVPTFRDTLILQSSTQLPDPRVAIHKSRLSFLGAFPYPGHGDHITVPHEAFSPIDTPVSFEISPSYDNRGPFSPALPPTVAISSTNPYFLESFPKGQKHGQSAAMNASDWFNRFTCGKFIPSLRVLSTISTGCGFFCSQVYESICLGFILATEGVPSPGRLSNVFLVYAFLSMKPGNDNPSLLRGER